MLYNFAKLNGKADVKSNASNLYTDMKNVSEEIQTAVIGWDVPAGILGGTTDTTMNPYGAVKRAHVAAMLYSNTIRPMLKAGSSWVMCSYLQTISVLFGYHRKNLPLRIHRHP